MAPKDSGDAYVNVPDDPDNMELIARIRAKKEDRISPALWGQKALESRDARQFIVRYRELYRKGVTKIVHGEDVYTVTGDAELGNGRQWLALLAEKTSYKGI